MIIAGYYACPAITVDERCQIDDSTRISWFFPIMPNCVTREQFNIDQHAAAAFVVFFRKNVRLKQRFNLYGCLMRGRNEYGISQSNLNYQR
jgi:hypothetical protein